MPEATPSVLHGTRFPALAALDQAEAMLDLGEAQLELVELLAAHEPELGEEALQTLARPLGEARSVAAPADHSLLDQLTSLVATQAASLGKVARELVDALGGQRHGTDRGQAKPLGDLAR